GNQLATRSLRRALHGSNDRLWAPHDRAHQLGTLAHQELEVGAAAIGVPAVRRELLEVVPSTEGLPLGGDDDRAHAGVLGSSLDASFACGGHRLRQAVALLGTRERQKEAPRAMLALEPTGPRGRPSLGARRLMDRSCHWLLLSYCSTASIFS